MNKLTKKEWEFCKKLHLKIASSPCITSIQKTTIIDKIKKECNNKYKIEIRQIDSNTDLDLYEFNLNEKKNYIIFNMKDNKPTIIPAGMMEVNI